MAGPSQNPDVWELFLAEARKSAKALTSIPLIDAGVKPETLTSIRSSLSVLESGAWMVGAEEAAEALHELRRALRGRKTVEPPFGTELGEALAHLLRAVDLLASPGSEEARIMAELDAVKAFGQKWTTIQDAEPQKEPSTRPDTSRMDRQEEGRAWTPQVDPDLLPPFFEECSERLQGLSQKLLTLEQHPADKSLVADLFRDLHTIKGSSAFVGLGPLNRLSHAAEDLVGQIRDGTVEASGAVVDVLLNATDVMTAVLQQAVSGEPMGDVPFESTVAALTSPHPSPPGGPHPTVPKPQQKVQPPAGVRPPDGDGRTIRVDFSKLDGLLNLVGELLLDKAAVRSVLEGLDSTIRGLNAQSRKIRRSLWGASATGGEGRTEPWAPARPNQTLRSLNEELGRVERVLAELAQELDLSVGGLDFVSGQLRDQVMKLRMVPIASVFAKHRRNVRDLSRSLGKKVRLELQGQETELDKMLVEQLDEPLLHLVRNAVDHGIEPPSVRLERDKPAEGHLKLKAEQRGNQFVVEVSDDGQGIEAEQLRRNAVQKGILSKQRSAELSEKECLDLVFSPGFSTALSVTDLSGRGVGLDVVKERVSRLRGTVEVASKPGQGTTFILSLPLTLAIRQVLLLRVAGELTALPIDHVKRSFEVRADKIHRVVDRHVLQLKDRNLPVIWLCSALGLGHRPRRDGAETVHVVQVNVMGHAYGLLCDGLEGKREIVIKSLGSLLARVPCVAGATLVGDRVVLILDLPDLVRAWIRRERAPVHDKAPEGTARVRRTVLLVEDSVPIRQALRQQFQSLGFDVLEARDGLEALELAASTRLDLVSTDAMMPNMDGYELTRALRRHPDHCDVPIVMISVKAERIDKVRGFDAGVDGYLVKPTDLGELAAMVQKLLGTTPGTPLPDPEAT